MSWEEFEEAEAPRFDIKNASLSEYSESEINAMARETEMLVSKHLNVESKWSGHIVVDDKRGEWLKDPSCDIVTTSLTSPSIIMHEQLHARSSSRTKSIEVKVIYHGLEEASVQLLTQEICKAEGVPYLESGYDDGVEALRMINSKYKLFDSDYTFAIELMKVGLDTREARLTEMVIDSFGEGFKIEENLMVYADYQSILGRVERCAAKPRY